MKGFYLSVLLAASVLPALGGQSKTIAPTNRMTVETDWNSSLFDFVEQGNVTEFHKKANKVAKADEATSKLSIHLDYGNNYTFKSVSVVDMDGVTICNASSRTSAEGPYNNLKDITFDVPAGTFTVVAAFSGGTPWIYHISENVEVNGEKSLTITPDECTNELSFRALNNKGERFIPEQYEIDRYGNKTPTGYKNCFATYLGIVVYANNHFFAGASSGETRSTIDRKGNISNGEENWNVRINNVSPASGVMGFTYAVTPEGTYVISLPTDGCQSQMVSNDYSKFTTREVKFVPSRNQRHALNSQTFMQSYGTNMDIVEGEGQNTRKNSLGMSYIHFQCPMEEQNTLPEIADVYIFNERNPDRPCPLTATTSPTFHDIVKYDPEYGHQNVYFTMGQTLTTTDQVKPYPSLGHSYTKTEDAQELHYFFNDNYRYDISEPIVIGGNIPILTFANSNLVSKEGPWAYTGMDFAYVGPHGELRESDVFFTQVTRTHADNTVTPDNAEDHILTAKLAESSEFGVIPPVQNGFEKIKLTFHNDNIMVDDMVGVNDTEINYYCDKIAQYSPLPVMRMLQIKEGEKVTNHISDAENATLGLSIGNFKTNVIEAQDKTTGDWYFSKKWVEYSDLPFDVKVEYAPHESTEWKEFAISEIEDQFQPLAWGKFFSGSFSQVNVGSPNNWYDLRVTITYDENNNQIQTLSPAFNLNAFSKIEGVQTSAESVPAYYNLQGLKITHPQPGQLVIEVTNGKSVKKIYR